MRDRAKDANYYKQRRGRPCASCGELAYGTTCMECRGSRNGPVRDLELIRAKAEADGNRNNRGLGNLHQQAVEALRQRHVDGSPCDWCGRPMWLDAVKNFDYDPQSRRRGNGALHGDHPVSRQRCLDAGLPVPIPNRLLHGLCNQQRGDGRNDHLAWVNHGSASVDLKLVAS